jgi:hypothetical protein
MLRSRSLMALAPITAILALLALACSSSPVPPTTIPSAITTGTVVPLSTLTPGESITPPRFNAVPPKPIKNVSVSLEPIPLDGWASALIVSSEPNATESSSIQGDGRIFVSWALTNKGPDSANSPFSIDLLLDGVPVERWSSKGLFVDEVQSVRDWSVLPSRSRLTTGEHLLTLVVDSTGYVQDQAKQSNSVSTTFDWPQIPNNSPSTVISPERLPNLSPFIPADWEAPFNLEGLPTQEEALSTPRDPRIQLAYNNSGLSSIKTFFLVYLYFDNVLITKFSQLELVSNKAVITPPWRDLLDTVHISIGYHVFSMKLDPTNLIDEMDESDNVVSFRFYWGGTPPNDSLPSPLAGNEEPLLSEYVPSGWSGSLIVTSYPGRTGALGPVYQGGDAYVSWAIQNDSVSRMDSPFTVDLLLGGSVIRSWTRPGLEAGAIDIVLDELLEIKPSPGVYEMRLLAHTGLLDEGQGPDQLLTRRSVGWLSGEAPVSVTELLEPEALARQLTSIETLRSSKLHATNFDVELDGLHNVVDAVYQSLYQRPLMDEPLAINILTDAEFEEWVDAECRDVAPSLAPSVQGLYLARCETTKGFIGYHTSWRGAFRIVVKGDRSPMQVLSTLAHELGHFRQSLTNPALDNHANLDVLALREAQAYAHQILFFRTLESLTGLDLLLYPELAGYETFIETQISDLWRDSEVSEHARGQLILWLALLADPKLRKDRTVLLNNLSIPAETAQKLFNYLVDFSPGEARLYVTVLMKSIGAQVGAIEALALARLVPALPYWIEGSPDLREIGLLMP